MPSVNYSADDATAIANPERGFIYQLSSSGSEATNENFFSAQLANSQRTFFRVLYTLGAFTATAISAAKLTQLDTLMNRLRSSGAKCILRARYELDGSGDDASHDIVLSHITQMQPYLSAHADVIPIFEAGFIGSWGEWAFSQNYGNTDGLTYTAGLTTTQWSNREAVVLAMLSATPADTFVSVRCPYFKMHFFGNNALSVGEAFAGTNRARTGHFNDAYVSGNDDFSTYVSTATDRAYLAAETNWLPFGGESAAFNATYGACTPAQTENARMHISYLNIDYHPDTINNWSANGCLSAIARNLGYRFQMISSTYASTATIGQSMSVNLHMRNTGYAAPYGRRTAYYVMRNASQSHAYALAADCRFWGSGSISVNETISLSTMPAGTYDCYLWLPDRNAALSNRPAYSIRFANQNDIWDATLGANNLQQSIAVVAAEDAPVSDAGSPFLNRKLRRFFG